MPVHAQEHSERIGFRHDIASSACAAKATRQKAKATDPRPDTAIALSLFRHTPGSNSFRWGE
jgi:hypothetical protein